MHTTNLNDSGNVYFIINPEMLVFLHWKGRIVHINTIAEFDRQMHETYPHLGHRAHKQFLSRDWRNVHPQDRATSLVFTWRNDDDGPDLEPARDWQDQPVLDISCRGLLTALSVLAWQRNQSPKVEWLFDHASGCMRSARAFLDASAWFWTLHDRKRAEWAAAQAATVGDGGVFHVPTAH